MQLGLIGLGRMGANIARRLLKNSPPENPHEVVVYNRTPDKVEILLKENLPGLTGVTDIGVVDADILHASMANAGVVNVGMMVTHTENGDGVQQLVALLKKPRVVWIMLPAGDITEAMIWQVAQFLEEGDTIIDGGNTFYKDDIRRAKILADRGINYLDIGTSGGIWGLERGYCMMIGGDKKEVVQRLNPLFATLAPGRGDIPRTPRSTPSEAHRPEQGYPDPEQGYIHAGPVGAGHFVKMVHNGIEYGLMQAYAEGFDILKTNKHLSINVAEVAEVWRRGSVVSSWLLDLTASALAQDPNLEHFVGEVADSGEGRWTIDAAVEQAVPVPVLASALFARFRSRIDHTFADKLLSAMRKGFGGHVEEK